MKFIIGINWSLDKVDHNDNQDVPAIDEVDIFLNHVRHSADELLIDKTVDFSKTRISFP